MDSSPYNASVTGKILLTPDLMILRVRTDEPRKQFSAGQFTSLGLMAKEQRSPNSAYPIRTLDDNSLIKRPYSIASANMETMNFEFYISQLKSGQLTPRLFNLANDRRIWVDNRIVGVFHLNNTPKDNNVIMIATGTGLAPYISFLRSHMKENQNTKIAIIQGASHEWDLGYQSELQFIDSAFDNFYYFPTLLRPESTWNGLTGSIEKHLDDKIIENNTGIEINPEKTHIFLCGNPNMVKSVSAHLLKYNYTKHTPRNPGSLHTEEY